MDVIAEHRLEAHYPDGVVVSVCLRVGRPKPHSNGDYVCPVQAEGLRLWQGPKEFWGRRFIPRANNRDPISPQHAVSRGGKWGQAALGGRYATSQVVGSIRSSANDLSLDYLAT